MSDNNQQGEWQKRELGALWLRKSQKGQKYLSGHLEMDGEFEGEKVRVVVFSNKDKKNDKAPDYRIYKSTPQGQTASKATAEETTSNETEELEEDVL